MKVVRLQIPSGEPGTDETVRIIRQLIESGKRSLKIRYFAEWILKLYNVTARDRVGEIAAIHDWAKKNIRYLQDPYRVEYVQTPERLLVTRSGDCDDFTALVGSLVEAIGYPVDIKVVAKPGRKEFHHVYPVARIGMESVGLDASMPVPLGYEAPEISRSKIYRSESNMLDVFGNPGLGLEIQPPNGITRRVEPPLVITGGNGTRKIELFPKFVRGVSTYLGNTLVISPGNPLRAKYVRKLFDRGFFVAAPGSSLTIVDFADGISEVAAMKTGNGPVIYPPPPGVPLPGMDPEWKPPPIVGPNGLPPGDIVVPTEGAGPFGPIIYLKLGQSWSGYDAKLRMDTGNLRPATPNLMLVYKRTSPGTRSTHGTVTAVVRTVNGNGAEAERREAEERARAAAEKLILAAERVTVPEYDIFGQPTAPPIVVTTPGAPAAGIDTKTLLMIGGGLLVVMMLMRK